MEELSLKELLNYYKSKIIIIIVLMIVTFCASIFVVNKKLNSTSVDEKYVSSFSFYVASNDKLSFDKYLIGFDKALILTYEEILKSDLVLNNVIETSNIKSSPEELRSSINLTSIGRIIKVKLYSKNKSEAKKLSGDLISAFREEIKQIYVNNDIQLIDDIEVDKGGSSNIGFKNVILYSGFLSLFISLASIYIIFHVKKILNALK